MRVVLEQTERSKNRVSRYSGFWIAFLLFASNCRAEGQSLSCESHKDGDAIVTSCQGDNHKSVLRCDTSGCTSSSWDEVQESTEDLRKFCKAALELDCAKVGNICDVQMAKSCGDFATRIEFKKKSDFDLDCNGIIPQQKDITSAECERRRDEALADDALVKRYRTKYQSRERQKHAVETIKSCDKNLLDRTYCEEFRKNLAQQPDTEKDSRADAAKGGSAPQK
jgi:hypothetical protein